MSQWPVVPHALIDVEAGAVVLANMLAGWLDENRESLSSVEACDEFRDQRTTPKQDSLCICAAIDAGAGAPSSGEHRAPVRTPAEGFGTGLEGGFGAGLGPGPWEVGSTYRGARRFQDAGSGSFDGTGGGRPCTGGFAAGALEPGLASIAGTVRTDRYVGDRRRWLLQPSRFQRRIVVGIKGDDGSGRTSSIARAPPRWQAQ